MQDHATDLLLYGPDAPYVHPDHHHHDQLDDQHHHKQYDDHDRLAAWCIPGVHHGPGGVCGETRDGNGALIKTLTCGGLNVGGGGSIVQEGPTPDGATNLFRLNCAADPNCTIGPFSTAPAANSADPDCSDTGCNFGTPLEIPVAPPSKLPPPAC
jgi:hypothetical protein